MNRAVTILRNIGSNWVGFAVNASVTLLLTPLLLRELGAARYGISVLTASIIGYYGVLDLGFRAGVTQYLMRYLALRDYDKASQCISSAVVALAALSGLLVFLSVGAAALAPKVFDLPNGMEYEAFWCILIVGLTSAIELVFFPFTSIFTATQRFDLANLIGIGTRLLTAGGILFALKMGYGLIGVSTATCGASLVDYLIRWRVTQRLVPELSVSPRQANVVRLREIATFGAWNFLISINAFIYLHLHTLLIGAFMPIAAVGQYALATSLVQRLNSLLTPIGQTMHPAAAELYFQGDRAGLEHLYHDGSRLMMLVMSPVVLVAAIWSEDFYRLWIGEEYLRSVSFHSVALLFQILLISTVTSYFSNISGQILRGAGDVRTIAIALICGSALNLTSCVILIGPYGLAGLAASTVIASIVVDMIAIPLLLQKRLGLSVRAFLQHACLRPVVVAGILGVVLIGIRRVVGQPGDWPHLILQGILAGGSAVVVVLMVGVTGEERHRFFLQPIRYLLRKRVLSPESSPVKVSPH